jgi:hypothetical protein
MTPWSRILRSLLDGQETPCLLWHPKLQYHVRACGPQCFCVFRNTKTSKILKLFSFAMWHRVVWKIFITEDGNLRISVMRTSNLTKMLARTRTKLKKQVVLIVELSALKFSFLKFEFVPTSQVRTRILYLHWPVTNIHCRLPTLYQSPAD